MIRFQCDYGEGAHPACLDALVRTNFEQTPGYGEDEYCAAAAEKIRALCAAPGAGVHFAVGGTQVNLILIAAALRPHEGALCAVSGHINTHESGAIEATGHKCIALPSDDGKITAEQVRAAARAWRGDANFEHVVKPGLVYISIPTELGTNYRRAELDALYGACREYGLFLYADGARLACALADETGDLDLPFLAAHTDAFTIGGTKNGMLFGEALVIANADLGREFRCILKQRGGMLAKGRLMGLQYQAMLENGRYFETGRHAVALANRVRAALRRLGIEQLIENGTNQIFPILPDAALAQLSEKYAFAYWERADDTRSVVRIVTSWATKPEDVDALIWDLGEACR